MKTSRLQKIVKRTSPTRMFVVSFVILIFIGTVLLTLPISAKSGQFTNPVDALFTATSAACVTGLSVYDTFMHWSYFGQGVLLVLIQCGGLGLAAFATGLTLLVRRRIGIRHLVLARESAGGSNLDVISLLRIVVAFTFAVEALGALLLMGPEKAQRPFPLSGEAYNFGPAADVNNSVAEVVKALSVYWPGFTSEMELNGQAGRKECTLLKLCCDKSLAYLGWKATLTFDETIRYTAEWYSRYYRGGGKESSMLDFTLGQIRAYAEAAEGRGQIWVK